MLKKITFCLLLVLIAGCDTNLTTNRSFKWAVINQGTIQTKVTESFRKDDPFYKENAEHEENRRNLSLITQQISDLTQAAAQKCTLDISKIDKNKPSEPSKVEPSTPTVPSQMAGASPEQSGRPLYGDEYHLGLRMGGSKLMQNPAYQECLSNIRKDQLIIDLKDKKKKIESLNSVLQQHDNDIRKKINEQIELAIAKYAEKNGYQLIVGNNSPQYVIYNHDKVVLDVTNDVIDYILKNKFDVKLDSPPQTVK